MEVSEVLYNKALRFLSFRPRSEKEVRDNLLKKGKGSRKKVEEVDQGVFNQVIEKLKEKNFVNDEEFTKWWIEQRTKFKAKGLRLIKIELRQKGILQEMIESQISLYQLEDPNSNEKERAKVLLRKIVNKYQGLSRQELYQKLGAYLGRRGFDYDVIKEAVDDILKERV